MNFFNLHTSIEAAALLSGLLLFKNYRNTPLKWALPFLFFIMMTETAGWIIRHRYSHTNGMLYNFTIPIEYSFYFFLFSQYILFKNLKRIMLVGWIALFFYCIVQFYFSGIYLFIPAILLLGNCLMILCCCFYFWQLFQIEEERPLLKIPIFWIFMGVFLFNLGELSYSLFARIMIEQLDKYANFFGLLINILIIVLYSCFIIGFSLKDYRYKHEY